MSRSRTLRLALAALCCALSPVAARPQTCSTAAFSLFGGSYMDSQLNPPPGEDLEFFTSSGGIPTIYFLLDNSGSMQRLSPNGPGFYVNPPPPLNDVNCPTGGDVYDPGCKNQNVPGGNKKVAPPGVVGCGLDSVSAPYAGGGTAIGDILLRSFSTPCGQVVDAAAYLAGYNSSYDYAHEASVCPYYKNPAPPSGKDGFDPDFYCGSNGTTTTCPTVGVNYFDKNMVFHESIKDGNTYPGGGGNGFNGTDSAFDPSVAPGNGWTDTAVLPFLTTAGKIGSIADFCAQYGTVTTGMAIGSVSAGTVKTQGGTALEAICNTCLTQRGFFFDGYAYRQGQEGLPNVLYPSIWLTGNYLNFFPPKFIVARKALKDLLMNNLTIRSGIATFGGGGASCGTGAAEIQKLNPACNNVYDTKANLWSNRSSFMTAINKVGFNTGSPLAEALLNVSQQFRTPGLSWFDGTCTNSGFEPPSATNQQAICFPCQTTNVVVISDGRPKPTDDVSSAFPQGSATATNAGQTCTTASTLGCIGDTTAGVVPGPDKDSCPNCQGSAAVGGPGGTSPFGPSSPDPILGTTDKDYLNNPIRVAWLLNNFDFRRDDETAYACNAFTNKQAVTVYTLGFGTSYSSDATALLGAMARVGGGIFATADNPSQLSAGFANILTAINTRATSFSVASVNALQATAGQSVIVPRFNPSKAAFWNGHLYRFELFSEFAAGCTPGGGGDLDCDCSCTSVFLQDATGAFISEDTTGTFKQNVPNLPTCGPTNHCSKCGAPSTDPAKVAVPYWDASSRLLARSWKTRAVYTVIDDPSKPDGRIDSTDPVLPLIDFSSQSFNSTTVSDLIPYMGLTLTGGGNCSLLSSQLAAAGDSVGAGAVGRDLSMCAEAFLAFVLGADVLNQDLNSATSACAYPPASSGTDSGGNAIWNPLALCDRGPPNGPGKLGDVFHSSPVRVLEPEASSNLFSAYNNQTLGSLWLTSTKNQVQSGSTNAYAYDDYAATYNTRRRLVVVGANDGLFHAFDGGNWNAGKDDPLLLPNIHTSSPPFNGYYDKGTGDELWAFLPPDLLAKVPLMLGTQHQFFIDGDPMVRDVWVDGGVPTNDGIGGTAKQNDVKEPNEFHTVAVVAERRGGTRYFGLDVTDATLMPGESGFQAPRFLWIFPQPNDPEGLEMGETFTGFLPGPPPIVPVRLDARTVGPAPVAGVTQSFQDSTGTTVPVHERWVVLLPGGFDPQYVRGHGVHMLDVWTGQELFNFSRPPNGSTAYPPTDPRWKLDAPVAGSIGPLAFGPSSRADAAFPANGGYFDTATFGDANGALWTLRFSNPGSIGANGQATNWFGGRSFQFARSSASALCAGRQPFFYVTANVPLYSSNRMLRVLAGTGDRFNLLDQYGGTCGPDNIRACMLRGCTVSVPQAGNSVTVDSLLGTQSAGFSANACTMTAETMASGSAGTACNAVQGSVEVDITNCANMDVSTVTATSKAFAVTCSPSGTGAACAATTGSSGSPLVQSVALNYNNWFISVRAFDDTGPRAPFTTLAQAAAYDGARLTETDLTQINGSSLTPATTTADSTGWAMYFNHDGTVTDPASGKTYNIAKADERTASPASTPGDGCIYWNSVQPALLPKSSQCPCTFQNTDRLSYFYGANVAAGGLCLKSGTVTGSGTSCAVSNTPTRSMVGTTLTTPPAPQPTWFVNSSGQVSVGLTSIQVGSGATNVSSGLFDDAVRPVDWLPVTRSVEACRHAGTTPPPAAACQ
jgi:type IV pilus assembly protein PilY1